MQNIHTIAFYNVENLFDIENDILTNDDDFTPNGELQWTEERYQKKIIKIANTIANIGKEQTNTTPTFIGLAEIENKKVLDDLISNELLINEGYKIIHYDSKDERGIDVAFLYKEVNFKVTHQEAITIPFEIENDDNQDYTRDILYITGDFFCTQLHVFVNHWPSKRMNDINKDKRELVGKKLREKIDTIFDLNTLAHIVLMGDFNQNPNEEYFKTILQTSKKIEETSIKGFYNPMEEIFTSGKGTEIYHKEWNLFDQILYSKSFTLATSTLKLDKTLIFDKLFIQDWDKNFKGQPFRTYIGKKYLGGYSDHFPVFSLLKV